MGNGGLGHFPQTNPVDNQGLAQSYRRGLDAILPQLEELGIPTHLGGGDVGNTIVLANIAINMALSHGTDLGHTDVISNLVGHLIAIDAQRGTRLVAEFNQFDPQSKGIPLLGADGSSEAHALNPDPEEVQ